MKIGISRALPLQSFKDLNRALHSSSSPESIDIFRSYIAMKAGKAGRVKMRQYKIQNPTHFLR